MPISQLERLKQDVIELDNHIQKLVEKGKQDLVTKLERKRAYLSSYVAEREQVVQ
jgi:cell division protein FtsB